MEIVFNNVTYSYKNKRMLDRINLVIEDNKITGITGEYKTVLCKLINGTKEYKSGEIVVGEVPVIKDNIKVVRKMVSMIHQNYEDQFFTNNVKEEILFLISRLSYKPSDIDSKMKKSLEIVGLEEEILNKEISSLTTGEKKLLQIAVSIIYNPDVIIFDEPFVELDKFSTKNIISLIKKLKSKFKKTVIIVSNDVNLLYELTDNIVILSKGHIAYSGETLSTYQSVDMLLDKNVEIPDLVRFTMLARDKRVKLSYHRDIRDLIKDVYKHV